MIAYEDRCPNGCEYIGNCKEECVFKKMKIFYCDRCHKESIRMYDLNGEYLCLECVEEKLRVKR